LDGRVQNIESQEQPEASEAEVKRRRNPSPEQIGQYGKRLPYIVAILDKAMRYADGTLTLPPSWDCFGMMPHVSSTPNLTNDKLWEQARRNILIRLATTIIRTAWITKSMEKNKKSPYIGAVLDWYTCRSIMLPEDIDKVQETLREFHEGVLSGLIKGDAAKIENYHRQQDLAQYLKQLRGFLLKGGGYETLGCVRAGELGKYVLFRIDDYETAQEAFKDTNWCVRAPEQFRNYGPPYFMVVNTKVADGQDDRVCLMHDNSKQIKDVGDSPLSRPIQKELKPFMEFVFGRWACKYNMTDGDSGGDLDIGDQWWPLDATTPFEAVGEILDVLWSVCGELVEISEHISTGVQDQFYDDAQARYKKEHPDDEEAEGFEEWFEKWSNTEKGCHELGSLEEYAIENCDVLTREAFGMFAGLTFDPECGMDYIIPKIFGTSWDKMKKLLSIRQDKQEKVGRTGHKYTVITGHTVGGNPRFNRSHTTPKMETWAERSIDRFLAMLPDERDFARYTRRNDQGVWGSLAGAKRAAR
jgi:hypothetical protein